MKNLQTYLIENLEYSDDIKEGKIWDSIKGWFKSLFEPSDKEFDRYSKNENGIRGSNLVKFKKYLDNNYDDKFIKVKLFNIEQVEKAIRPQGLEPNEDENFGFYQFAGKLDDKTDYYGLIYDDKNAKDTACIINSKITGSDVEILNLQVIQEFTKYLPMRSVIKHLKSSVTFVENCKRIIANEQKNKNLYKQLINDCDFEKKLENGVNVAILELNKESK